MPPLRSENKNRVLSFSHYNKTNPCERIYFPFAGFYLCRYKISPRTVLSERGIILCKFLIIYRFFYAKAVRFPRGFSNTSRRAATCRPPKTQSVFPIFFRVYAEYNFITSYILPLTSTSAARQNAKHFPFVFPRLRGLKFATKPRC